MVTQSDVQYLLTKEGGGGIGLHFPLCDRSFDIELKFATVIEDTNTFQVWGTRRAGLDIHHIFQKLRVQAKRELYYSCFLSELYGDHGQMLLITLNFKVYSDKISEIDDDENVAAKQTEVGDAYRSLTFPADIYNVFVQHVDGVFRKAVRLCYGYFVSLTEPIISQPAIDALVTEFKARFSNQYWAIAKKLLVANGLGGGE
jgi:hypothetical protein